MQRICSTGVLIVFLSPSDWSDLSLEVWFSLSSLPWLLLFLILDLSLALEFSIGPRKYLLLSSWPRAFLKSFFSDYYNEESWFIVTFFNGLSFIIKFYKTGSTEIAAFVFIAI